MKGCLLSQACAAEAQRSRDSWEPRTQLLAPEISPVQILWKKGNLSSDFGSLPRGGGHQGFGTSGPMNLDLVPMSVWQT